MGDAPAVKLTALALNCTLKPSSEASSTDKILKDVAKRVLERTDAFLEETDAKKRMPSLGKVGIAAVVGNEDGAHHYHAKFFRL